MQLTNILQYPTYNTTRTHPQADWAIALASLLPSAEVLLVATQPQNARTPECPHNAQLATLLPTPQMPQRWFHILYRRTVYWIGFSEQGIAAPNLVQMFASFQLETKVRLPDKTGGDSK